MKQYWVFDNGGKTIDRYTIIFKNGECYSASENPFYPCGIGIYTGNIGESYYIQTIGVDWNKGFSEARTNSIVRVQTKQQIEIARGNKDWLGEEVTELATLPEDLQKYIEQLQKAEVLPENK